MLDPTQMQWDCHICKEARPDEFISVQSSQMLGMRGIHYSQNVRYCNDRPACIEGALTFKFVTTDSFAESSGAKVEPLSDGR